jgi:hypothetical protein
MSFAHLLEPNVTAVQCAVLCMSYMTCSKYYHVPSNVTYNAGDCFRTSACGGADAPAGCTALVAGPKPCNNSGACLVCPEHPRRAELESSYSEHTQMWLSTDCSVYVAGGNHSSNYTLTRARHVEVFAQNATLDGYVTAHVPFTMHADATSATVLTKPVELRSTFLRMTGAYEVSATGSVRITEVLTRASIDTIESTSPNHPGVVHGNRLHPEHPRRGARLQDGCVRRD